jgi:hypothetical protein
VRVFIYMFQSILPFISTFFSAYLQIIRSFFLLFSPFGHEIYVTRPCEPEFSVIFFVFMRDSLPFPAFFFCFFFLCRYLDDFLSQKRAFEAQLEVFLAAPGAGGRAFGDACAFMAQVSYCYPQVRGESGARRCARSRRSECAKNGGGRVDIEGAGGCLMIFVFFFFFFFWAFSFIYLFFFFCMCCCDFLVAINDVSVGFFFVF